LLIEKGATMKTYTIKPLVWEHEGESFQTAYDGIGFHMYAWENGHWQIKSGAQGGFWEKGNEATMSEAKAAAEAEWHRIITEALEEVQ
jgi:hypothetical protein